MIGGGGEKVMLRLVAEHAHIWNAFGDARGIRAQGRGARRVLRAIGRDPAEIERSVMVTSEDIATGCSTATTRSGARHIVAIAKEPDFDLADLRRLLAWRESLDARLISPYHPNRAPPAANAGCECLALPDALPRARRATRPSAATLPAMEDAPADVLLVARCANGDEGALAELYDRFGRASYALALRIVRDASQAEDVVQEAFLDLWRYAARFDPARSRPASYLLTFVHRRAVDLVAPRAGAPAARRRRRGHRASAPAATTSRAPSSCASRARPCARRSPTSRRRSARCWSSPTSAASARVRSRSISASHSVR